MKNKKIKGNCDAELVLQAMIDYPNYNKAIIVSGDGNFHCLIHYLLQQDKLGKVIIPDRNNYLALLKKFSDKLAFLNDLKHKLEYKNKKAPGKDKTLEGSFCGNSDVSIAQFCVLSNCNSVK